MRRPLGTRPQQQLLPAAGLTRLELRDLLVQSFARKQKQRKGVAPEVWIEAELKWAAFEVNSRRTAVGKPPLILDEIRRVESSARGHTDYTEKFALYCVELVLDF